MKKTFVLFALFIIGVINCNAQLIHTGDFVKITLPDGVHKLSKQQVEAIPQFKLTNRPLKYTGPPDVYKTENISLGLFIVNTDAMHNDFPRKKNFLDHLYSLLKLHGNNSYTSSIKNMGKNQVLIINYKINDKGYYRFYYQNESKTLTQAGEMEYNMADQSKAEALLNDVLNNIRFTK
jgi:hypothetical protein